LHLDLQHFNYQSALFIHSESGIDKNFKLASSNIPKISILNQKGINVKDLILYDKIFIEQKSISEITKRLS
jgi:ribosomal protein L4